MAVQKVKFVITQEDLDQAGKEVGEFVVPKNGLYVLELKEINSGFSKDDDGKEDRKRPRLECIYDIVGETKENLPVEANYGNIWDYISFSKEAGWRRAQFLTAFGLAEGKPGEFSVNIQELVNRKVLGRLRQQKGRNPGDEPRARLAALSPFTDEDMEDAFGSEEEDTEASEYLTEEALQEMDMKTLGETAREFDIEPNEYVKKVRGKNHVDADGLITAILEAQAAPEGEEGEDEESPF